MLRHNGLRNAIVEVSCIPHVQLPFLLLFLLPFLILSRTCPGRCDALQSWICLQGWSSSLLLMLKSEPNRLFKMSWTKSKLPVSLQSGKTELFWCKFTLIPPRKCHQIIILSTLWKSDHEWPVSFIHLDEEKTQHLSSLFKQLNTYFLGKVEILKALRGNMFSWIILSLLVAITNPNP